MKKYLRTLQNQRGVGLLIVVAVLAVLVAGLIFSTQRLFDNTVRVISQQRDRIASIQVLQDFAVLAQKANEVFVRNNNACPGGWTAGPVGFCWQGPFPNARDCVVNPIGGNTNICLVLPGVVAPVAPTMNTAHLTAAPVYDGIMDQWRAQIADIITYRHEIVAELQKSTLGLFDNQAHAIRPEPFLPDVGAPGPAGPAELTINNIGCGGPFVQPSCKICAGAGVNVRCIELRVCVSSTGCRNINNPNFRDWFRQRVAIIPRS